ncbi:LacI family DNA-binding transcriptional regulator [Microbulbifer rhizosphaerae]|uniref:LacI family repressor for deo operon, udp, cdd, tsx, nupC, and nupG n=1 Tax=Microbulbifer rhizosphaerae TaxID=1562603 RepID=A0A7W4WE10_9GAMM|nr:LacI family DNA-binding transcriptional regulator [Microbulbifer rhizosphaerae]MBB3062509.1 LacI family repressor for deo operon, udp, cdd, tsx, nupC, and nupG [Microbulbifer rhizosphaerae]
MSNNREVAKLAGVSVATVSRALQKPELVSLKTRNKVLSAIKKLDYRPNLMAAKFRSGKSGNLVVLVPTVANLFFARVISGMQEEAHKRSYSILLCNTFGNPEMEEGYAKMVHTFQADGVIQLRAYNPFGAEDAGGNAALPMVNACEVLDDTTVPTVALDNRAAARAMTEHLLQLGHRRIAVIKGPKSSPLTRDRLAGYRDALEEAGIAFDESLLCPGDFTLHSGHKAAGVLIDLNERPTAIFCENDEMAIGAIQRIKQSGLRVPDDISVAGFDDIAFAPFSDPPLTTIAQPAEEFGSTAVSLLIDLLEGRIKKAPKVILPFELVVRASTGPASIEETLQ